MWHSAKCQKEEAGEDEDEEEAEQQFVCFPGLLLLRRAGFVCFCLNCIFTLHGNLRKAKWKTYTNTHAHADCVYAKHNICMHIGIYFPHLYDQFYLGHIEFASPVRLLDLLLRFSVGGWHCRSTFDDFWATSDRKVLSAWQRSAVRASGACYCSFPFRFCCANFLCQYTRTLLHTQTLGHSHTVLFGETERGDNLPRSVKKIFRSSICALQKPIVNWSDRCRNVQLYCHIDALKMTRSTLFLFLWYFQMT